ncbi:MAG: HEPN domain-containing protein [Deltaproteobacteria bacterium]|nr:HEPN domain-containing protein [Deltaproteobacteria bacterium]
MASYLSVAAEDLDAARRLSAEPINRMAAFHLQQAAEKLVKALLLHRGVTTTAEHRIAVLLDGLEPSDPWRRRLAPLDRLTPFATTYRYPTPGGRLKPGPDAAILTAEVAELEVLHRDLAAELLR